MIELAKQTKNFEKIVSIFGIANWSTTQIIAELKDITIFDNIKQINDSCGLDCTIVQSGKSINYRGFISKRGNRYARADQKRIKQVLINIIKNSIEASINPIINIKLYKRNNNIIIKIIDNGKGMTKEEINNLFLPFESKKENGTGLGLCLSKEIIDKHNGTITFFSNKNHYTEVTITLPY